MPLSLLGLGGGMIVNGLMNALVSSVNSRKSIEANQEMHEKNQAFQEAQQKKQWRHAEQLQREMRELTRKNFLEQLEHQRQQADLQALEQRWPLQSSSPRLIINEFNNLLIAGDDIPLQLIIAENGDLKTPTLSIANQVRNAINELNKFMSVHYGQNSATSVKIYDNTKPGARFGAAEVDALYQVFKVAPTMVISSRVHNAEYIMECWYWGCGMADKPVEVELFRCNVKDLQLKILKETASEWLRLKHKFDFVDPDKDALADVMGRLQNKEKELRSMGAGEEDVREYAMKPFEAEIAEFTSKTSKTVNAMPFIQKINDGIERTILSSFKLSSALVSDAYFLLEHKVAPKFMCICAEELRSVPMLQEQSEAFFRETIKALPEARRSERALMHAQMAVSYKNANQPQKALEYGVQCSQELRQLLPPEHFDLEASEEMLESLKAIKEVEGVTLQEPWIAGLNSQPLSPDELNHRAAGLYNNGHIESALSVWRKSAQQGHLKSIINLANVLLSQGRNADAFEWVAAAIRQRHRPFYSRGHILALWFCQRGEWANAFSMWCAYLESADSAHRAEAEAYSAFIIFTAALKEITEDEFRRWINIVGCDANEPISPCEYAENFLLSKASDIYRSPAHALPFCEVLSVWYLKSCGQHIPFIYDVQADVELKYVLPRELPSEVKHDFGNYMISSQRPDIKEYINDIKGI